MKHQYRFDGKHIETFATDSQAWECANSFYDDRSAHMEKLIDGVWHYYDYQADIPEQGSTGWINPEFPYVKSVDYFYPTSPNSERFKMVDGYSIALTFNGHPPIYVEAFLMKQLAIIKAQTQYSAIPWAPWFLKFNADVETRDWKAEFNAAIKAGNKTQREQMQQDLARLVK